MKSIIWALFRRLVLGSSEDAENIALRHQVHVLRRQLRRRPKLTRWDHLLFAALYLVQPDVLRSISIVCPDTVVRRHRARFRLFWRVKSRGKAGRPRVPVAVRRLIRQISVDKPLGGALRIHGELLKLGINVSQSTIANYMVQGRRTPSQSWLTFLRKHANDIAAIDLFVVPAVSFRLLFGFVVLNHGRRQSIHVATTYHPTAEGLARQIAETFPWEPALDYKIRDRDRAYGNAFRKWLSAVGIRDRLTAPRSPWQNGYIECAIGSIRRDLLDHVIVLSERHLQCLLSDYADDYNRWRTHLDKDAPWTRPAHRFGSIIAVPKLGGLHHAYVRI